MKIETTINLDFSDPDWCVEPRHIADALVTAAPAPVHIDLSGFVRPSTLVIQALLCAAKTFRSRGQSLELSNPAASLSVALTSLGLTTALLEQAELA